ncbi:MFS transporter [Legionella tunisiensis]|uniref:MFS transporter n=1 Tax=Legionella tunisiensis TaxID=1034944 RepID=UPI0002E060CE|nr:MFS transporter [Legionella tunisiensis]
MIQGFSLLLLIYTSNFYAMSLLMLLMGLGSYLYITSSHYILNSTFNSSSSDRVNIISAQAIITNVGMLLSAILMGYCADGYYLSIFIAIAVLMLIVSLAASRINLNIHEISESSKNNNSKVEKFLYCTLGLLSIGAIGMMYSFHRVGYPIFLSNIFGNISTGYLMAVNPLIIIFLQKYVADKFSKTNELLTICTGLFLFSLSFLILNLSSTIYQILLSCCILTIGEILSTTYAQSIVFGYSPIKMRGRILGVYKATYSVTKLIGSYLAGSILYYSEYHMLWLLSGVIGFIIFL